MKPIYVLLLLMCMTGAAKAQYTMSGKIEYERKINLQAQMAEMDDNDFIQKMKSQLPKFIMSYFDMIFDTGQSIYKPGREIENQFKMFGGGPASENIVHTDFTAQKVNALKTVYESKFYVQDTMRVMDWVEKEDIRTIAGYKCHKAVGRICDSVYVVAFYTEDIMVAGGPELFGGLPGMILEFAVPRLHTTWTATKVEPYVPKPEDFTVPEKGKKVTEKELYESVKESFKAWGKMAPRNIWWTVL